MKFKKFISSVVSALMMLTLLPPISVSAALNEVEITSGKYYDAGSFDFTYAIESAGLGYFVTFSRGTSNYNSSFGYNFTQYVAANASPYTRAASLYEPGVYRLGATISGGGAAITPAYFAVFPNAETDFIVDEAFNNQYVASGLEFSFSAASRNSDSYTYCLTKGVDETGEPTQTCNKTGSFNFGERVSVGGTGGADWSDLEPGEYVLAVQDGTEAWAEDPDGFEILAPVEFSLNSDNFTVGQPLGMELTFSGASAPYNLEFRNAVSAGNLTNAFGVHTDVSSPVSINTTINTPGVYGVQVKTPDVAIYSPSFEELTDSQIEYFGVYEENENLVLDISTTDRNFIQNQLGFSITGASKNAESVEYCVATEVDGREPVGDCVDDGTINRGENTSLFNVSDIGIYYITLTDGEDFAEPIEFRVLEPLTFTTEDGEEFSVGTPLGITITPAGGEGPYNVSMHRYTNFQANSVGTTIATGVTGAYLLDYAPVREGAYVFRISDSFGLTSGYGFRQQNDFSSFKVFSENRTIFIDYNPGTQEVILIGTSFQNTNFNIVQKTGNQAYYCLAADEFIDDETGEVLDDEECLSSGSVFGNGFAGWVPPSVPTVMQLAAQNTDDETWAEPVDLPVDYFKAGLNDSVSELVELDAGTEVDVQLNSECSNGSPCAYYVHNQPDVSNENYTYSQEEIEESTASFETDEWQIGNYYVKAYNNSDLATTNNLELKLRDPNSNEFLLDDVSSNGAIKGKPFQDRNVAVSEISVEADSAKVVWNEDVEATATTEEWERLVTVTGTKDLNDLSPSIQTILKENSVPNKVSVDTGLDESVQLNDEVIVAIPVEGGFDSLENGLVLVSDGAGNTDEIEACATLFTGNSASEASVTSPNNYVVPENSACYVLGTEELSNFVYIATRHLTDFIVGEEAVEPQPEPEPEDNNSGGSSGGSSGSKTNKVEVLEMLTNKALDAPKTLKNYFGDLEFSPAKNAINALKEMGVVQGYEDGNFRPANTISRAEFVKVLAVLMKLQIDADNVGDLFADVKATDWYYPYVKAAKNNGIVTGSANEFKPHTQLNLAEVSNILFRVLKDKLPKSETTVGAPESLDKNAWYYDALMFVNENRLVNSFTPGASVSRGDAMILLYNVFVN